MIHDLNLLTNFYLVLAMTGGYPDNNTYNIIPQLHISLLDEILLVIFSGAVKTALPKLCSITS